MTNIISAEEKAAMLSEVAEICKSAGADAVKKALEEKGYKTEMDAMAAKIKAIEESNSAEEIKALKGEVEKLALDLKAAMEKPGAVIEGKLPSTAEYLKNGKTEGVNGEVAVSDVLKRMHGKNTNERLSFEVKAVGTMTTGSVTPTTPGGVAQLITDFDPRTTPIPRTQPFFMDYMNSFPIDTSYASWAEMKNPEGGAAMTAEGALKSQADFEYVEAKAPVETVTAYIKTSKQALADINQLRADIDGELTTIVRLKADSQALDGDGNSPNLNGIMGYAQAFNGGGLSGTIFDPNEFDVIAAAINQIYTAEVVSGDPAGFLATHCFVNPTDYTRMLLRKETTGAYLFPVMLVGMDKIVNVMIVSNPRVPSGEFLIGDMTKANLRLREGLTITVGYENQDFTKNLVTILGEMRLVTFVKSNHVKAFVTDTFAAAIELLTIPT